MKFSNLDIVLHSIDDSVIGIVQNDTVEWWSLVSDMLITRNWDIRTHKKYLKPFSADIKVKPYFLSRLKQLGGALPLSCFKETDTPLIRKIKELDYKWELRMKEKGNFYLTSRVLNADQKIISQSTQTDTVTASGVIPTRALRGTFQPYPINITPAHR